MGTVNLLVESYTGIITMENRSYLVELKTLLAHDPMIHFLDK
jgi:hypothetical protein